MRTFRHHLTAITIIILFGCASHAPIQSPKLSVDLKAQQDKKVKKNVEVMMKPIHSEGELKAFYDDDLVYWGMMPVHVSVKNMDSEPCYLGVEYISLIYPDGKVSPALSVEQAYQKGRKSYGRAAGWGCAFGIIGAIPSLVNVEQTNKKIKADYETRILKSGEMPPGAYTEGAVFFDIDKKIESLDGLIFKVGFEKNEEPFFVKFNLSGQVKQPRSLQPKDTQ